MLENKYALNFVPRGRQICGNHRPSENIFFRCEPYIVFKEHHEVDRDVGDAILLEDIGFV